MNRTRVVVLACVAVLASAVGACEQSSSPTSPAGLRVIASGHPEWPPVMFQNGDVIDGAGPALVTRIFDDLGHNVAVRYTGTWDEVQAKARTGEVDVLVAAYKTAAREEYMLYSDAYTTDPIVIYVAAGEAFTFDDWDVLIGKHGVAMVGDSYGQEFDDFAEANLDLTRATTVAEAFELVGSGQADYLLYSMYAGDDYLDKAGQSAQFESLPTHVNEENFYITISKQSPFASYLPQINDAIAKYKADGTIAALIAQYRQ